MRIYFESQTQNLHIFSLNLNLIEEATIKKMKNDEDPIGSHTDTTNYYLILLEEAEEIVNDIQK